jgi:YD repeat-containing protein
VTKYPADYDALGRITEVKTGGEVTKRYSYSNRGRVVTYTDGLITQGRQAPNSSPTSPTSPSNPTNPSSPSKAIKGTPNALPY